MHIKATEMQLLFAGCGVFFQSAIASPLPKYGHNNQNNSAKADSVCCVLLTH